MATTRQKKSSRQRSRGDKHSRGVTAVMDKLRELGFTIETRNPREVGYDLLINDVLRVAIKYSLPGNYRHSVTVGGKRYSYNYRNWNFNFHRHKCWDKDKPYCDILVCIAVGRADEGGDEIYIIPWSKLSGPTFSLHQPNPKHAYGGRYKNNRDNWSVFSTAADNKAAPAA